ncbi:MAG: hypothetical protein Q8M65_08450, partial [Rhodoglobus sp.]|nr:hypothetical protein [Rhodoglobus sp.]
CEFVSTDHSRMIDGSPTWWTQEGVNRTIAGQAFDILLDLLGSCDPMSMRTDPITALDRLVNPTDAVQYIPLVFGYVTYSLGRQGQSRAIFVDAPGGVGTLTGGVGLAVSAQSVSPRQAADFVQFASCQRSQQGTYVTAGGQPASLGAWRDPNANVAAAGFFQGTLDTLQKSFLRPRAAGYPQFQRDAADAIHSAVAAGATAPQLVDLLDDYWSRIGA